MLTGVRGLGQSLLLFFNEHSSIRHTSGGHGGEGIPCGRPRHASSMMALLIHYHKTIWRSFTGTTLEQSIAYSKVKSNLCCLCAAGFHSLELFYLQTDPLLYKDSRTSK
jgi:hypothetical protein